MNLGGVVERAEGLLATVEAARSGCRDVLEGLNELAVVIDDGYNAARLEAGLHSSEEHRDRAAVFLGQLEELRLRAASSAALYERVLAVPEE